MNNKLLRFITLILFLGSVSISQGGTFGQSTNLVPSGQILPATGFTPIEASPDIATILAQDSPLKKTPLGRQIKASALGSLIDDAKKTPKNTPKKRSATVARIAIAAASRSLTKSPFLIEDTPEGSMVSPRKVYKALFEDEPKQQTEAVQFLASLSRSSKVRRVIKEASSLLNENNSFVPLQGFPNIDHLRESGHHLSPLEFDQLVVTPTRNLGAETHINPSTGVWTGFFQEKRKLPGQKQEQLMTVQKTGFPVGIDTRHLIKAHQSPEIIAHASDKSLEMWNLPGYGKIPVERIPHPDKIMDKTFYPIWYLGKYSDKDAQNIPNIGTFSPTDVLSLAQKTIDEQPQAIQYQSPTELIIDIAPTLKDPIINKGIYVVYPRNLVISP